MVNNNRPQFSIDTIFNAGTTFFDSNGVSPALDANSKKYSELFPEHNIDDVGAACWQYP